MHTAFSFTTLSASGTRFRMLPNACAKTGAVLLVGFHEAASTATVLEDMLYLSLESSIQSSNNDCFASISHHLTEIHDVWELQEAQKQQVQEEGQHFAPDPALHAQAQHGPQGKRAPCCP